MQRVSLSGRWFCRSWKLKILIQHNMSSAVHWAGIHRDRWHLQERCGVFFWLLGSIQWRGRWRGMWAGRWWIVGLSLFYNHYSGWSVKGSVRRIEEDPKAEMKYYISILYQRVIVLHHRDSTAAQRAQTNTEKTFTFPGRSLATRCHSVLHTGPLIVIVIVFFEKLRWHLPFSEVLADADAD